MKINLPRLKFRGEYFPFLLPIFYVLHYYFVNYPFFPIRPAVGLLLQYLISLIVLQLIFFIVFKSWRKASLYTFSLFCLQFFFIFVFELLSKILPMTSRLKEIFLLLVLIMAWSWFFLRLQRHSQPLSKVVRFLNVLMISWIATELVIFIVFRNYLNRELNKAVSMQSCSTCSKPDIYLLILDEYAGEKTLVDYFHFDNSEFLSYLRKKHFRIIQGSKSNYNVTLFSMASMLSMDEVRITNYKKPSTKDFILAGLKLKQSPVGAYLLGNGYKIYNASLFPFLDIPPAFRHSYERNFVAELASRTLTGHLQQLLDLKKDENKSRSEIDLQYNNNVLNFFEHQVPQSSKPKFVYAHFLMPHFPHILNENGALVEPERQYSADTYLGYLKYTNQKIVAIIEKILSSSPSPIILLMSDHGFRGLPQPVDQKYYFLNLNAVFLPDQDYTGWYDGMSNVNQFRLLFNKQFNQHLPLLKDTSHKLMGSKF